MDDDNSSTLSTSHSDSMEAEEVVLSPEDVELGNNIPLVDIKSIFANYSTILAPRFPPSPSPQSPEWSLNQPNTEQEPLAAVPEARSNVSNTDDPTIPCNTFRVWFLGLFFSTAVTFLNQLYSFRDGRMSISYLVVILICLPLGHLMARILPRRTFRIWIGGWKRKKWSATDHQHGRRRGRSRRPRQEPQQIYEKRLEFKFCLNPGPFSVKEHALVISMVRCAIAYNNGIQILLWEESLVSVRRPIWAELSISMTMQMAGFGLAGGLRRILVQPARMVWPETLVIAALIRSLHSRRSVEMLEDDDPTIEGQQQQNPSPNQSHRQVQEQQQEEHQRPQQSQQMPKDRRMSRMRYFWWICLGSFIYSFLPAYIFPTLSSLSILCWIAPENLVLSQLTGSRGLGIGTVTLNWAYISDLLPLLTPWWVQANMIAGMFLISYLASGWGYYSDVFEAKSYPILGTSLYSKNGSLYNGSQVVHHENWTLNEQAYEDYGPVRLPLPVIMTYFFQFAILAASVSHTLMYHGLDVRRLYKFGLMGPEDVHTRMMRAYPEVPDLWYQILVGIMIVITMVTYQVYGYMPWWVVLMAFALTIALILPAGIIAALTNQTPVLPLLYSCIIGYLLPGHVMTAVVFRTYAVCLAAHVLTFLSGLKLGHYLKVPPRMMFWTQIVGGFLGGLVNLVTYRWILTVTPDICSKDTYACPTIPIQQRTAFLWGAIGPKRIFGNRDDGGYGFIQLGLLVGAALPVLTWYLSKKVLPPRLGSLLDLVHWPVIMSPGVLLTMNRPYMTANSLFVGFIFMFVLRRYRFEWWSRYTFLTSIAVDTGVVVSSLVLFFTLQTNGIEFPEWWGNPRSTPDYCPLSDVSYRVHKDQAPRTD